MTDTKPHSNGKFTLQQVAHLVGARLVSPDGVMKNETLRQPINAIATLEAATESQVSFLANSKYSHHLSTTKATAVLVSELMAPKCSVIALVVEDPYVAFAKLSQHFEYKTHDDGLNAPQIASSAQVDDTAILGQGVVVGHHATIGKGVVIGQCTRVSANTVIEDFAVVGQHCDISAGVIIHHHCQLGDEVRIHANASIGADGFGFAPVKPSQINPEFRWERIAQLGRVMIGNRVSIGANTCIDRGALDDTIIGNDVIIDNLVQIAHNVRIGDYTAIAACTGIAGSTKVGRYCVIGGGVGITGHVQIADGVTISGGSNVLGNISSSGEYASGVRHMPTPKWRRAAVNFKQLAEYAPKLLASEINDLKNELNALKSRLGK